MKRSFYNAWIIISIGICLVSLIFYFTKLYDLRKQRIKYEKKIKSYAENTESIDNQITQLDNDKEKSLFHKSIARTSLFLYVAIFCTFPEAVLNAKVSLSNNRPFLYFALFMSAFKV